MDEMLKYICIYVDSVETSDQNDVRLKRQGNCTVMTIWMKGKRKRWLVNGANNIVKLLNTCIPLQNTAQTASRRAFASALFEVGGFWQI